MAHVDDGTLNALLDGELGEAEATAIRGHLATCAECSVRFEDAKRFLTAAEDLLGLLAIPAAQTPPAAAAVPPALGAAPVVAGAPVTGAEPPRRVSKTAKEVAVDIDGATHKSPAILPNVPREGEIAPRPRSPSSGAELRPLFEGRSGRPAAAPTRRPDWATLAWAASVVLALGVGYLANEVKHSGPRAVDAGQQLAAAADTVTHPAARAPATHTTHRPEPAGKAAADAFAAARPLHKPRSALRPKAVLPVVADAGPTGALAGAGGNAGYRAGAAAAPVAPNLNQPAEQRAAEISRMPAAAPAAAPAPTAAPRAALGTAPARLAPDRPAFRLSDVDAAAARLSGNLRVLDGLSLENVKIGPGTLVPGAQPDREVVRIAYADPRGHRMQLDQQRLPAPRDTSHEARGRAVPAVLGLAYGDTLVTAGPGNTTRIRWLDPAGLWLSLSGNLPADSLRALLARVR